MKRKRLTETPVCPQERLVIISYTTSLSFALKRIGLLTTIIVIIFYLLVLYLHALSNTLENLFASIYSESLIKTVCQHLLILVGFDTLIYWKYYDTPHILVGNQWSYAKTEASDRQTHLLVFWRKQKSRRIHEPNVQGPHGWCQLTRVNSTNTIREKSTASAPNLLTVSELQLASDTNVGGNALSLAHCIFAGDNYTYCRRIATFARGNVLPLANIAMRRQ
jgi:F0F1-type ATP synthase assembly protein I